MKRKTIRKLKSHEMAVEQKEKRGDSPKNFTVSLEPEEVLEILKENGIQHKIMYHVPRENLTLVYLYRKKRGMAKLFTGFQFSPNIGEKYRDKSSFSVFTDPQEKSDSKGFKDIFQGYIALLRQKFTEIDGMALHLDQLIETHLKGSNLEI